MNSLKQSHLFPSFFLIHHALASAVVLVLSGSAPAAAQDSLKKYLVTQLKAAGWKGYAPDCVVSLNLDRYEFLLKNGAKSELDKELAQLKHLKNSFTIARFLEQQPEAAGLLCLSNKPETIVGVLKDAKSRGAYDRILDTFVLKIDPWELDKWAAILEKHGNLALRLIRSGIVVPDYLLEYPLDEGEASEAYGAWLESIFQGYPSTMSDEKFGALINLVAIHGRDIFGRMKSDEGFRSRFKDEIWPKIERVSKAESEATGLHFLFAADPAVWDLLLNRPDDGDELLRRAGTLASDVLYGEKPVPVAIHEKIADFLKVSNWEMLDLLSRYVQHPLTIQLIQKDKLGPELIAKLLTRLEKKDEEKGGSYQEDLVYLSSLSNKGLLDDIAPHNPGVKEWIPGYGTCYLIKKLYQGRNITVKDALSPVGDVIDIVTLLTPIKGGSALIQKVVREGGEMVTKRTIPIIRKELGKRAVKEIEEAAKDEQVLSKLGHWAIGKLPKEVSEKLLGDLAVDITPFVKSSFRVAERLGMGRQSFKKITGLEPRLFMRPDGKVFLSLPEGTLGRTSSAIIINRLAKEGIDKATEKIEEQIVEKIDEKYQSAWWAAVAAGNLFAASDDLIDTKAP